MTYNSMTGHFEHENIKVTQLGTNAAIGKLTLKHETLVSDLQSLLLIIFKNWLATATIQN